MNKLTIRNKNGSYKSYEIQLNDTNILMTANRVALVFEPGRIPVLRTDFPILDCDVELDGVALDHRDGETDIERFIMYAFPIDKSANEVKQAVAESALRIQEYREDDGKKADVN